MYKERVQKATYYALFVGIIGQKPRHRRTYPGFSHAKTRLSCRTHDLMRGTAWVEGGKARWMCRAPGCVATVSRTASVNQLGTRTRDGPAPYRSLAEGRFWRGKERERRSEKREEKREGHEQKDGSEHGLRESERIPERKKKKRDGETARILFAIKARDNLKAITITHGLRVHTLSPSARSRSAIPSHVARFADRFAWPSVSHVPSYTRFSRRYARVCP